MKKNIEYNSIGTIFTSFSTLEGMPVQSLAGKDFTGTIVIHEDFENGLMDLNGFSHIILIYHLHRVENFKLKVTPFMDDKQHGIFATRSPLRPNPIGISIVRLLKIENVRSDDRFVNSNNFKNI